jgi:hypothetical protein
VSQLNRKIKLIRQLTHAEKDLAKLTALITICTIRERSTC